MKTFNLLLALAFTLFAQQTEAQNPTWFHLLLDSETVSIASLEGEVSDGRYATAQAKSVNKVRDEFRDTSTTLYAFDCKKPIRIAVIQRMFNLETGPGKPARWAGRRADGIGDSFHPRDLDYLPIPEFNKKVRAELLDDFLRSLPESWPDETTLVAEFACRTAVGGETAKTDDADILRSGTLSGGRDLACEIMWKNGESGQVKVTFYTEGFVQLNSVWTLRPEINDEQIKYKYKGIVSRINRTSGVIQINADIGLLGTGKCDLASALPKRF